MPRTPRRLRPVALTVAVSALFSLGTSTALALRRAERQALGLHGCTADPWPYRGGERHAGPPGQY
jgi:hypothetical protein